MTVRPHIGSLREKPLHAALKAMYARHGDRVEEPVEGFVVDIAREDQLIEIQTRGFASMKRKLDRLLAGHSVHLVHPIGETTWIVKVGDQGTVLSRRRSPKRGAPIDVFAELVSFPELIANPNLTLEVALVHQDELRRLEPGRAWRRKGWVVQERRLLEVVDQMIIATPDDLLAFLPDELPDEFTTADLAAALGRPRRLAQQMAYCLRRLALITEVAKLGNAVVYSRTGSPD